MFVDSVDFVELHWSSEVRDPTVLQVGREATFSTLLITGKLPPNTTTYTFEPPGEGIFWWRIVTATGEALSEARKFTLIRSVPPDPVFPQQGEAVYAPGQSGYHFYMG